MKSDVKVQFQGGKILFCNLQCNDDETSCGVLVTCCNKFGKLQRGGIANEILPAHAKEIECN